MAYQNRLRRILIEAFSRSALDNSIKLCKEDAGMAR